MNTGYITLIDSPAADMSISNQGDDVDLHDRTPIEMNVTDIGGSIRLGDLPCNWLIWKRWLS